MKLFNSVVLSYLPKIFSIILWLYYYYERTAFFLVGAIVATTYSFLLYFVLRQKDLASFDGTIEIKETDTGGKSFQLIVNKDPETFKDQDKVVFLFKDVS